MKASAYILNPFSHPIMAVNRSVLILLLVLFSNEIFAQNKPVFLPYIVQNGDTFPVLTLHEFLYGHELNAEEKMRQQQFGKLLRDVSIVMPYAQTCARKMKEMDDAIADLSHKDRRHYLKDEERKLKSEFQNKLKDLTPRQGRLLIKLIDRETGKTSYSLIKEYRNGFTAFFWQGFASLFGMSLKEKYNREEEAQIEYAIQVLGYN